MANLRAIDGGGEDASREEEIDRVVVDEIVPLIENVRAAANTRDLRAMRANARLLAWRVNKLLDKPDGTEQAG